MLNKLIIFGTDDVAELAYFYFNKYTDYKVEAFCLDEQYLKETKKFNLPILGFAETCKLYSNKDIKFFVALGYSKVNELRKNKYKLIKNMGYKLASFISSQANILSENQVGENVFILEDNTVQPFVQIGNNVTLWSGNHIGHHSHISDHCFISSHVVVSGRVCIEEQCFLGVNSTIRDHLVVGKKSVIGAGSLILSDVKPNSVYRGVETKPSSFSSIRLSKI